jgi:hypothetical protein
MDWQYKLIFIYCTVCELWEQGLAEYAKRMSNNQSLEFTDQEIITIYLNGIANHRFKVKDIYNFTSNYLREWFPGLCSYEAFSHRLNQIHGTFAMLSEMILSKNIEKKLHDFKSNIFLTDSLPIIMAKASRSLKAKVAKEIADQGYCDSKKLYYHGIKLNVFSHFVENSIPIPSIIKVTSASVHDLTAEREIIENLHKCEIYGDKAYCDSELKNRIEKTNNTKLHTPVKLTKTKKFLDFFESIYSTAVSKIRQPIESFFNWLIESTGIQNASKVRSYEGLMVHVYGKLAAGLLMLNF